MPAPAWLTATPIAHRGFHDQNKMVWENTIPAFERAIEASFAIECDVRLSKDGVPFVFHDDDLKRLCGRDGEIETLSAEEIDTIAVGDSGAVIPRFSDFLKTCKGIVPLVVELKRGAEQDSRFVPTVAAAVRGYEGPLALMSFDAEIMRDLTREKLPFPLGLTALGDREEDFTRHRDALAAGLDFISYYYEHLDNDFIAGLRKDGIAIITWTVRDPDARAISDRHGDQMTFEGFDPRQ